MIIAFTVALLLSNAAPADPTGSFSKFIESFKLSHIKNLDETHPNRVYQETLQALFHDRNKKPKKVIQILEGLIKVEKYQAQFLESKNHSQFVFGPSGGFQIWRELTYLLLGRAYYETDEAKLSLQYLKGIPIGSRFYPLAALTQNWIHLKDDNLNSFIKLAGQLKNMELSQVQKQELSIQNSMYWLQKQKPQKALKALSALQYLREPLLSLKTKVETESQYKIFLKNKKNYDPAQELKQLNTVLELVESIPADNLDPSIAFLAGETYWHLASHWRLRDPYKFESQWMRALSNSEKWLTPWVLKSKPGQAVLSEEAFFFYSAILWEQKKKKQAIASLERLPKIYPLGQYREDAYQLGGDYYFDIGDFRKSIENYRQLTRVGEKNKAVYGLYKAGWAYFNLKEVSKAIKHIGKIIYYYRNVLDLQKESEQGSLLKEAEKDYITMLVEEYTFKESTKKLGQFKYSKELWIQNQIKLSEAFQLAGHFSESITGWQELLITQKTDLRSFEWLVQLSNTLLKNGQRMAIPLALETFVPELPKNTEKQYSFQHSLAQLLLTLHREARKTDDQDIWKATDQLYSTFSRLLSDSQVGDIWFYGAQRNENKKQIWKAIDWYKKSAVIKGYKNAIDSSVSILRLQKEALDELSLNKDGKSNNYLRASENLFWYLEKFPKSKEVPLAQIMYIESLHEAGLHEKSIPFVAKNFRSVNQSTKNLFSSLNKRFYRDKLWQKAFDLSSRIHKQLDNLQKAGSVTDNNVQIFLNDLEKIKQESGFQAAFKIETQNGPKDMARKWYHISLNSPVDKHLLKKTWHNLIIGFDLPAEFESLKPVLNSYFQNRKKPIPEARSLDLGIHLQTAKYYEIADNPVLQADHLRLAANLTLKPERKDSLLWEALVLYGSYYQESKMSNTYHELQSGKSLLLHKERYRTALARFYFNLNHSNQAWDLLKNNLSKKPKSVTLLLLRDLLATTKNVELTQDISSLLSTHQKGFKKDATLFEVWQPVLFPQFYDQLDKISKNFSRSPANAENATNLKSKIQNVKLILSEHEKEQKDLANFIKSWIPQVSRDSLCLMKDSTRKAIDQLLSVNAIPVASPQWNDFLAQSNKKIDELQMKLEKEKTFCGKKSEDLTYVSSQPFKNKFSFGPVNTAQILQLEDSWKQRSISNIEKIKGYLQIGAVSTAELVIGSIKSKSEKAYLLSMVRIHYLDNWNASVLLGDVEKDPEFGPLAKTMLASIAPEKLP
jgi:uncharacterized protein (UPF0332 family)/TolA-binding protein